MFAMVSGLIRPLSARERWYSVVLICAAVIVRAPFFGSPAIHIDEQFYLTVADQWIHHGLIPFVDIWDRKPIGVFLLYAVPLLVIQNGVIGYQIFATLFVVATCLLIFAIGRRYFSAVVGLHAAIIYAVALVLMEGAGGQTPVFYNALTVAASALYLSVLADDEPTPFWPRALLGSVLFGVALQIKYICAVEAITLSLLLLVGLRLRQGLPWRSLVLLTAAMICLGLLPTLAVTGAYYALGYGQAFIEANFLSIFAKRLWHLSVWTYGLRVLESSAFCGFFLPFAAVGALGIRECVAGPRRLAHLFLLVWIVSTLPGALLLGNPTRHYFLPSLPPLSILTAIGLQLLRQKGPEHASRIRQFFMTAGPHQGLMAILMVPLIAVAVIGVLNPRERGEAKDVYALASYLRSQLTDGRYFFVFDRLPILYYLAQGRPPSVYAFPNHLSEIAEVQTPDGDRLKELARVLRSRPPFIYVRRPYSSDIDHTAIDMLERTLETDYDIAFVRRGHLQFHTIYRARP